MLRIRVVVVAQCYEGRGSVRLAPPSAHPGDYTSYLLALVVKGVVGSCGTREWLLSDVIEK